MDKLITDRKSAHDSSLRIFMPAGNFNQDQGAARLEINAKDRAQEIGWRILPSDHSANFTEIWSEPFGEDRDIEPKDFEIYLTPPGLPSAKLPSPRDGKMSDYSDFARVYCNVHDVKNRTGLFQKRICFTICVAPTLTYSKGKIDENGDFQPKPTAPAGNWTIGIACQKDCRVDLYIQSDQSERPQSRRGLKSNFEDGKYDRYLANGEPRDSFAYPYDGSGKSQESGGLVSRIGTISALSSTNFVGALAGYRRSDGKPALYSSTAYQAKTPITPITAAYPTDDGPAHYGILASGASDGSVVAYRGTSMACALSVRDAVLDTIVWVDRLAKAPSDRPDLQLKAIEQETKFRPPEYGDAAEQKIGSGRMPYPKDYDDRVAVSGRMQRV